MTGPGGAERPGRTGASDALEVESRDTVGLGERPPDAPAPSAEPGALAGADVEEEVGQSSIGAATSDVVAPARPETSRERWARRLRWFDARYLGADPRTLGLARLVIGCLLCADTLRHWAVARLYYSNAGILPNHDLLRHPASEFNFSLFNAFSTPSEVGLAFALAFVCHACFALGFHTRVASVLSCLWVTSLDQRLVMVENGGYVVVNLLTFWLAFLPTGTRFSIDAWRRARREHRPTSVAGLAARYRPEWWTERHRSLASFAVVANLGIVYVFNVVNKYGDTWRLGASVHYVLHLDRMVTAPAVFLREHLPYAATRAANHLTLLVEALLATVILWPRQRRLSRPLAIVLMVGLHGTFGVLMRLGPFSWFMIGWSSLLLQRVHWEALEAWHRARFGGVTVSLHPTRPFALRVGRALARLDTTGSLTLEPGSPEGPLVVARRGELAANDVDALVMAWRALPCGVASLALARVVTLGGLDALLRFGLARGDRLERFFGWDRPEPRRAGKGIAWPRALVRLRLGLREATLTVFLLCAVSQLLHDNKSVASALKHPQPKLVRAAVGYLRIFQGWGMFAPNPVREDGIVAVEAWTVDGRRIDPFTGQEPDLDLSDARGLGLGQIEQDYFNRIRLDRNRVYHPSLSAYLQRWHERTGSARDRLLAFDVWWLRDRCPDPGLTTPTAHEKICLVSWRSRELRPAPGMPLPPPRCKEASAEKKD